MNIQGGGGGGRKREKDSGDGWFGFRFIFNSIRETTFARENLFPPSRCPLTMVGNKLDNLRIHYILKQEIRFQDNSGPFNPFTAGKNKLVLPWTP